jgi:homoserine dehydrogenase
MIQTIPAPAPRTEPRTGPGREPGREAGPRTVRVALAGCGTVGGELLRLLRDRGPAIERAHDLRFHVVRVLVRNPARPRAVEVTPGLLTADLDVFLAEDCDLVVEAIGGLETAGRIARHTLARGRGLISANKALLAATGAELDVLARERGGTLSYEAAVAGGVPVIRVLREALAQTDVRSIHGILNGTTNFILTRMERGASFAAALEEAQARGFAEADPTLDLNGQDAADKIAILAWQAFGVLPARLPVARRGLVPHPDRLIADAAAAGGTARLVAECVNGPEGVAAAVEPVVVSRDSALGRTPAEENLVIVETGSSGTLRLAGPGAGGGPTASAVLSDLITAAGAAPATRTRSAPATVDRRAHRWAVSIAGNGTGKGRLAAAAAAAGITLADALDPGPATVRALTGPTSRPLLHGFIRSLEQAGLEPVALRVVSGD